MFIPIFISCCICFKSFVQNYVISTFFHPFFIGGDVCGKSSKITIERKQAAWSLSDKKWTHK